MEHTKVNKSVIRNRVMEQKTMKERKIAEQFNPDHANYCHEKDVNVQFDAASGHLLVTTKK